DAVCLDPGEDVTGRADRDIEPDARMRRTKGTKHVRQEVVAQRRARPEAQHVLLPRTRRLEHLASFIEQMKDARCVGKQRLAGGRQVRAALADLEQLDTVVVLERANMRADGRL